MIGSVSMTEQDELIAIFVEESSDFLERIRDRIDDYETASDRHERFKDILRCVHTIKGGAGTCGFHVLRSEAHVLEDRLLAYKDRNGELPEDILIDLERAISRFAELLDAGPDKEEQQKAQTLQGFGLFDEEEEEKNHPQVASPSETKTKGEIKKEPVKKSSEMIRVPLDRIQRNIDIVSEIFLTRNQLKYLVERRNAGKISDLEFHQSWEILDNTLRKSIGDLESIAMSFRMMPIKPVFRMMEATVREYSRQSGKDIILETSGSDTDLDKRVVDSIGEPLIHLVRNAMDHGIEDAALRQKQGKAKQAVIKLSAHLEGNEVIIDVIDDGCGIDHQKVLESARNKGIDVSHVSDKESAIQLIFHPGFSTKQEATEVSGRGIGMDAVKNYVESLGGSLQVETELGRGSKFSMRIPLGLSVIRALIAKVNGVSFAISSADILEIRRIDLKDLKVNGAERFYLRGEDFVPCYYLGDYIYREFSRTNGIDPQKTAICNIILGNEIVSLRVDDFISNVEIVVKPMPEAGMILPYVTGVAILADGMPTFVFSLPRLYERLIKPKILNEKRGSHAA